MNQQQLFDEPKAAKRAPAPRPPLEDEEEEREAPAKANARVMAGCRWPTYVNDPRPPGYDYLGPQKRDFPTYSDEEWLAFEPYDGDVTTAEGLIRRMLQRPTWRLLIEDFQGNGSSDDELLEWVGYTWGLGGGFCGGETSYSYVGGTNPAFALGRDYNGVRKHGLTGKKLADTIRRAFDFPHPDGSKQTALW